MVFLTLRAGKHGVVVDITMQRASSSGNRLPFTATAD